MIYEKNSKGGISYSTTLMIFPRNKLKIEMFLGQMPSSLIPHTRCSIVGRPLETGSRCHCLTSAPTNVPSSHFSVPADVKYPTSHLLLHWWQVTYVGFLLLMIVLPIYCVLCHITKMLGQHRLRQLALKKTGKTLRGWKGNKNTLTPRSYNFKISLTYKMT